MTQVQTDHLSTVTFFQSNQNTDYTLSFRQVKRTNNVLKGQMVPTQYTIAIVTTTKHFKEGRGAA